MILFILSSGLSSALSAEATPINLGDVESSQFVLIDQTNSTHGLSFVQNLYLILLNQLPIASDEVLIVSERKIEKSEIEISIFLRDELIWRRVIPSMRPELINRFASDAGSYLIERFEQNEMDDLLTRSANLRNVQNENRQFKPFYMR